MSAAVLPPAVAGAWYPASRDALARRVDTLFEGKAPGATRPVAVIAPHAGFDYSGAVAAAVFAGVRGRRFDRIVLLGPSHHFGFEGAAVTDRAGAMRTPLGDVPIDREAVAALREARGFRAEDRLFAPEHSLEAELPFLQRALDPVPPIVPILLGGQATHDDAVRAADALAPFAGPGTLLVVSSDFTHFGPRFGYVPFTDDLPERISDLDHGAVRAIESGDGPAFARYVETTGATICGRRAIDVLLALPAGRCGGKLAAYDTSGRMTGAWDHSVSYASIGFP